MNIACLLCKRDKAICPACKARHYKRIANTRRIIRKRKLAALDFNANPTNFKTTLDREELREASLENPIDYYLRRGVKVEVVQHL